MNDKMSSLVDGGNADVDEDRKRAVAYLTRRSFINQTVPSYSSILLDMRGLQEQELLGTAAASSRVRTRVLIVDDSSMNRYVPGLCDSSLGKAANDDIIVVGK